MIHLLLPMATTKMRFSSNDSGKAGRRPTRRAAAPAPVEAGAGLTLDRFDDVRSAFAVRGDEMRVHKGRSVVAVSIGGTTHYLKRFWLTPSQIFQRHVARGLHEMRMIDWLNRSGFAGPKIVRGGRAGSFMCMTRVFFLMEEVPNEWPLEAAWRKFADQGERMVSELACFAARLHDAGFIHTDFSERHILVGRRGEGWSFRLIDLERARQGRPDLERAAADLATLAASISDEDLRGRIEGDLLADYVAHRKTLPREVDFPSLVAAAKPTKSF